MNHGLSGGLSMGLVALALAGSPRAQMEKRQDELYELERFRAAEPAVGSPAPDLVVTDLAGRPHALSADRGRILVVIKGGFT
jgi:hypothetical protein